MPTIQQWDRYEFSQQVDAPVANPFTDVRLAATVTGAGLVREVEGFYDGEGVFRLRFLGEAPGEYVFVTRSNLPALHGLTGEFTVTAPAEGVHGPVLAAGTRFRYADGAPAFIMGTTAYVWHHRPADVRAQTLDSLTRYGFNKIRMLVFPKHYTGGFNGVDISYEPPHYPFEGEPKAFDFRRPNPEFFRHLERCVEDLMQRGIEADVILFHPYDAGHWDIDAGMDEDDALLYVRYIVARLSAYRNVWWSLANEYDIDTTRRIIGPNRRHWDVIGATIKARDPYGHLISCHNIPFGIIYPNREWLTHVSYQHPDTYTLLLELQARYGKPVINDEYQYEGNVPDDWGNSSPELVVGRHWKSLMAGGYATHGEAFVRDGNRKDIFWSYGGAMTGESAPRLRYLREIAATLPLDEMQRQATNTDGSNTFALAKGHELIVIFCRHALPGKWPWLGPWDGSRPGARYYATVYDVWNCRVVEEFEVTRERRPEFRPFTLIKLELMG
jgi:hypothetical protein